MAACRRRRLAHEHLTPGQPLDVSDYIRLAADSPGVLTLVEHMRKNTLAGASKDDDRAVFIFRDGLDSAMEEDNLARHFTLMLAGRAKNIAPVLAQKVDLSQAKCLLDIGGGTGVYAIAFLQRYPNLRAIVFDRPAVLKVTAEFARNYGVADRLQCIAGDMFADRIAHRLRCGAALQRPARLGHSRMPPTRAEISRRVAQRRPPAHSRRLSERRSFRAALRGTIFGRPDGDYRRSQLQRSRIQNLDA